ncbi:MAG TPA: PIG-L family deacetylase, partial [Pyrinomonadaceae bacterium]|nr:PIG-L family deacetylase [Pyrinomonadaceae bacterium]
MSQNVTDKLISRPTIALFLLSVLLVGLAIPSRGISAKISQPPTNQAELHQALIDLTNSATVMCVAAHPDDEDGTTLTVLRRKYGVHTVSLFSTYGEGGQNAVGPELYEALGVIRARETQEAARIQGSEPHFLGLKDFGFSKSAEEAFRIWGHDEALRRMVYKIRELRPDVIITNHDTTTGHGHHQATGRLVLEAFDAAADPKRFPEQLTKVSVWQPKRLFVRTRSQGGTNAAPTPASEKVVTTDPNEMDPIRGSIYAAQALAALQKHASQGPWPQSIAERLRGNASGKLPLIRYRLAREASGAAALPLEAKTFLDGLPVALRVTPTIDGRDLTEILDQPDRILNALIDWRRRTPVVSIAGDEPHRAQLMEARAEHALAVASGVTMSVSTRNKFLVPGETETFTLTISNAGNRTIRVRKVSLEGWGDVALPETAEQLNPDTDTISPIDLVTPRTAAITVPPSDHLYDDKLFGHRFLARTELEVDGARFSITEQKRFDVAPAIEITNVSPSPCVRTEQTLGRCNSFQVSLTNHLAKPFVGLVKVTTAQGRHQSTTVRQIQFAPSESRTERSLNSDSRPSREIVGELRKPASVLVSISPPARERSASDQALKISDRAVPITYADARIPGRLRVGYLPSFDTTLEQSLDAIGVSATKLTVGDVQRGELTGYHTIVIDNRGYYAHPELIAANARLFDFAEHGGTLIVFYHKDSEWNPNPDRGRPQLAPYPIILDDERVTEEDAPIQFLQPR